MRPTPEQAAPAVEDRDSAEGDRRPPSGQSLYRIGRRHALLERFAIDALERLAGHIEAAVRFESDRVEPLGLERAPEAMPAEGADAFGCAVRLVLIQLPEITPQAQLKLADTR